MAGGNLAHVGGQADAAIVQCGACHEAERADHVASFHGQAAARGDPLAPTCKECHGKHDVLTRYDTRSPTWAVNIPQTCGRCHHEGSEVERLHEEIPQERILENYSESIHGEGLYKKGLLVTAVCTSCHSAHLALPHTDKRSSVSRERIAATCTRCHVRIEEVHQKVIEGQLWEEAPHQIPSCSDCHSPHEIRVREDASGLGNATCMTCHADPGLVAASDGRSMHVDLAAFTGGTHGRVACAQCHSQVQVAHERPCETITSPVNCAVCHAEEVEDWTHSIHGQLAAKGDDDAPSCLDCHDRHATRSRLWPESPTFARNVPDLCARCHRNGEKAALRIDPPGGTGDIVSSYESSVHGVGLIESGLVVTATCADCHGAHGELPASDPASSVNRANLAQTCGQCHQGIVEVFAASIHGAGEAPEGREKPVCEDCHTSHAISRTDVRDFRFTMMQQCGRCHEPEAETFFQTYHGKVTQLGTAGAAKCSDCHGAHDILPPEDPRSRLSRDLVVETCGQCHPGSNRRFAGYLTHATHHDRQRYPILYVVFLGMTTLLLGTLTVATGHTGLWLFRLVRTRDTWRRHKSAVDPTAKQVLRFPAKHRIMHVILVLTFFTLAITGMALKFSYMPWAQAISGVFGGSHAMGGYHRLAAATMMGLFAYHVWDLVRLKRASGLSWCRFAFSKRSLMFNWQDAKDVVASLKWFLGRGPRPAYGRFTYWEKFDWFAVFWGMLVIGTSGLALWFPLLLTRVLPGWVINVATIIHSDEALLATAFIFTVHFFNTHFRPDKFPMDPVIFTGCVPVEEMRFDKAAEYEDLLAAGRLEENLVEPVPRAAERWARVFGFTALGVGLLLVAAIVYTMLFGYR